MVSEIIIGSAAIKHWFPDFPRKPKDLDIGVITEKENIIINGHRVEYLVNPICNFISDKCKTRYLSPSMLLTLKCSHLPWNINWDKHMFDCQFLLSKDAKIDNHVFCQLYECWHGIHGENRRSDLTLSKDEFFDNDINHNIDHDEIHTFLKNPPSYQKILKDGCEVETDDSLFFNLPKQEKIDIIQEEVMAMASERYIGQGFRHRYIKMLKKFIQNHCPVSYIPFIVENYIEISRCPYNFMEVINTKLLELNRETLK